MFEKYYVIQWRQWEDSKWMTFPTKYLTIEAAKVHAKNNRDALGKYYRIAKAYVQIRYKAVPL